MLYYRVKPDADNRQKHTYIGNSTKIKENGYLVGNELYTARERNQIANSDKFFETVNVSKNTTYFFFGARFSTLTGGYIHHNEHGQEIY